MWQCFKTWPREQVPLVQKNALVTEPVILIHRLDAFGNDVDPQVFTRPDHAADDGLPWAS